MIVRYDKLNRLEAPKLTLCSPGSVYDDGLLSNVVGILTDHEAEEIVFNFNAVSELNFRLHLIPRDNPNDNAHIQTLYRAVQNRRLIFIDDIGYFMVTNIEDGYSDGVRYKDVSAQSIDVEIQQKMIPYIEDGTYRFESDKTTGETGIINKIVASLPLWKIGHIDGSVANKYRTFEDIDTSLNCLGFLMDNVQDAYECIFIFDITNRLINVYDQANYVRQTNIHLTKNDLINSLNITESADDLYTAISVMGDENVTISAINPLGTNVIYNFDYYLNWMNDSLRDKVRSWEQAVSGKMTPYYELNLQYYNDLEKANILQMDFQKYAMQITMYTRCRNNIVAESNTSLVGEYNKVIVENGGTPIDVSSEISETLSSIDGLISECEKQQNDISTKLDSLNEDISTLKTEICDIQSALSMNNYFTENELAELNNYIFEGSYTDEYVTITDIMSYSEKFAQMKILYDRATLRLNRVSQPTQEFSIDAENFVFVKKFEDWSEQLETGCLINIELEQDDVAQLFLSNITINYDDRSLNMTFGNRFNKFDTKSLFDDMLGDVSKSANTLNYIKEILYPIKNGEFDSMKEALRTSRNLTMNAALASENEEVVIDGSGYTGKKRLEDGTFDPHQVKLTGRTLVFTDDAWESCKVALGEILLGDGSSTYGINAETIIGNMIVGGGLKIIDKDGRELLSVVDGISAKIGDIGVDETVVSKINAVREKAESASSIASDAKGIANTATATATSANEIANSAVAKVVIQYYQSSSSTTCLANESDWKETTPVWESGKYIWSRVVTFDKSNNVIKKSEPACITGSDGKDGNNGTPGINGDTPHIIAEQYCLYGSDSVPPDENSDSWSNEIPKWESGKYIWSRFEIEWENSKKITHSTPVLARSIASVDVEYAISDSNANVPTEWSTTAPNWEEGKFIWTRTQTYDSNGACIKTSAPACITGNSGVDGDYPTSIVEQYYKSISKDSCLGGQWTATQPVWENSCYIWTRSEITWKKKTDKYYTVPVLANAINSANETATSANVIADEAKNTATSAESTANQVKEAAVEKTEIYYGVSNLQSAEPESWSLDKPSNITKDTFLWTKVKTIYVDKTKGENGIEWSTPVCISGIGFKLLEEQYCWSESDTEHPSEDNAGWTDEQPNEWNAEKSALWMRSKITWTDDSVSYANYTLANMTKNLCQKYAALDVRQEGIESRVGAIEADNSNLHESYSMLEQKANSISATIGEVSEGETITGKINNIQATANGLNMRIQDIRNGTESVGSLKGSQGSTEFSFDSEGLTVSKVENGASRFKTTITEDGMVIGENASDDSGDDSWTDVLTADNQGVLARNLHATTYLIVGSRSRFENYDKNGNNYTGCFWIGG